MRQKRQKLKKEASLKTDNRLADMVTHSRSVIRADIRAEGAHTQTLFSIEGSQRLAGKTTGPPETRQNCLLFAFLSVIRPGTLCPRNPGPSDLD